MVRLQKITEVLMRKGVIESVVYFMKISTDKIISIIEITLLKIRGYKIHYSVLLKGNNFFFQSTKSAIDIAGGTTIGQHTRISGGGSGKVRIGKNVLIGDFTYIMAHEKIEIGNNTKIASFCFVVDFNHKHGDKEKNLVEQGYKTNPIKIGENVWVGTHVIILPGVTVGDRAIIGAGSVVTKSIPAGSIAVGNPAKVIKK